MITLPADQFEKLLESAAERGAKKALAAIGLEDDMAPNDIRGLRDLFSMYRIIRTGFLKQLGSIAAVLIIGALSMFFWAKFGGNKP